MKRFFSVLLTLLIASGSSLRAQDIHFSQYYAAPVLLNPALTGGFYGDFRVVANYRNQWFGFLKKSSYNTYGFSYDMPLLRGKLKYDQMGIGVSMFADKSGSGGLLTINPMISFAYHKVLDQYNKHSLSFGVQAGITQRRIDFTKLNFEQQFNGELGFDPNISNGETNIKDSYLYPDVVFGVLWRSRFSQYSSFYLGVAAAHLHKPKESFLGNEDNRLSPRFNLHAGIDFRIGKSLTITPGFLFMSQNTAKEANVGIVLGYQLNKYNSIYFGTQVRATGKDAIIPMLAYEIGGFRAGISYDVNISDLNVASNGNGGIEISLIYIHNPEPPSKINPSGFCPKW